jgi:L-fuculose-phosphate aldolase
LSENELRQQICLIGKLMHEKGYIDGTSGNISARLDGDRVLTTPSGLAKGMMTPDELIIIDMEGKRAEPVTPGTEHLRPTSEALMHLECYRQRADVFGVVHAHPQAAVALTIAGYDFRQCLIPEMVVILGMVPTAPYSTPASAENRDAISGLIQEHDVIMLAHHGSLTVAGTVWDAYLKLETLEHGASILFKVEQLGGPKQSIPWHQMEKLIATREQLGLLRPGDRERMQRAAEMIPQDV